MGPVLENINKLIQMPFSCGEQNLLKFVPNIVVYQYLKATNQMTPDLESKTKQFMTLGKNITSHLSLDFYTTHVGYQRELIYQRSDYSYSAFGNADINGSTWLAAFVLRSFYQAKSFIFIDDEKLQQSIKYLQCDKSRMLLLQSMVLYITKRCKYVTTANLQYTVFCVCVYEQIYRVVPPMITAYVLSALIENNVNFI